MSQMFIVMRLDSTLRQWKEIPSLPQNEYPFCSREERDSREPLKMSSVVKMMNELRRISPATFFSIFPEYKDCDYKDKTLVMKVADKLQMPRL